MTFTNSRRTHFGRGSPAFIVSTHRSSRQSWSEADVAGVRMTHVSPSGIPYHLVSMIAGRPPRATSCRYA